MALAPEPLHIQAEPGVTQEAIRAFARLFSAICPLTSVQKVTLSSGEGKLDLWVLLTREAPEDEDRIYLLEREYRQRAGVFPLDLHVIPLTEVDERNLPPAEALFER